MTIRARILAAASILPIIGTAPVLAAPPLMVEVDHARVLKVPRPAATVIIGNPAIADVVVKDAQTLVLTGRSYGITNLIVLDDAGKSIIDESVGVKSFEEGTVRIYRQAERETLACAPQCEPTVTIGDNDSTFGRAASQFAQRETMAVGTGK